MATGGEPPDLTLPVKVESTNTLGDDADAGGFSPHTPLQDWEDGISVGGVYFQIIDDGGSPSRDRLAGIYRDDDGNIKAFDPAHSEINLLDSVSSGITEAQHRALRHLIHFIDGPGTGWDSGTYCEILPLGDPFPTSCIWYETSGKTSKIVEQVIAYNANKTVNTETWKVYDTDGSTILATIVDTYSYNGVFVSSVTRTWS